MDKYTATEQAYKHGYEKGYEGGKAKWIPVSERLPKPGDVVLAHSKYKEILVVQWDCASERWLTDTWDYMKDSITHWMPLPEPPKEGE